ncbi:MAG: ComEC/Rec2 family competence protein, partial [Flavobacteriales bacterium]
MKQLKEEFKTQLGKLAVEHQALCAGMILGDKTEIERQVLDQFRACGLMHVLAVSGMHVGLLASLPLLLLSFLPKNWIRLRFLLKLVSIVSVWGFAYFVGLGPSVVRSSIMFSAFLISSQRSHLTSKINLLCATAFTMLLVEPKWLFELGFQLSFVAVLGILLLGSMLTEVYSHFSWLVKKIFDVVNISVSAQLFTLPMAVYYFHEFPSYFLLGNLAIAPILVLSIYLCLLLILLNIVGCETSWLIGLIDQLLTIATNIAKGISELPNAVVHNLQISSGMVLLIYLAVGITVLGIHSSKNQILKITHLLCCVIAVSFIIRISSMSKGSEPQWLSQEMVYLQKNSSAFLFSMASEKTTLRVADQLEKQKGMQIKVVYSTDTLISIPFEVGVFHDLLFLEDEVY